MISKGQKLTDGKPTAGTGCVTDAVIHELTVYYGNSIRNNSLSGKATEKSI